jgi:hypothetical protein
MRLVFVDKQRDDVARISRLPPSESGTAKYGTTMTDQSALPFGGKHGGRPSPLSLWLADRRTLERREEGPFVRRRVRTGQALFNTG